ncbi:hypothetical protein CKAH01_17793 [Colletotrichum kahawae]|uniref:Uncharacterized protein n=1 Tax=Colletotrichum kahawae TaxID=34407 RepID=A0AAE0D487_COLKA|nr:hypothetical protein CKAH01_17793 [Colletotrichum kahawae]
MGMFRMTWPCTRHLRRLSRSDALGTIVSRRGRAFARLVAYKPPRLSKVATQPRTESVGIYLIISPTGQLLQQKRRIVIRANAAGVSLMLVQRIWRHRISRSEAANHSGAQ